MGGTRDLACPSGSGVSCVARHRALQAGVLDREHRRPLVLSPRAVVVVFVVRVAPSLSLRAEVHVRLVTLALRVMTNERRSDRRGCATHRGYSGGRRRILWQTLCFFSRFNLPPRQQILGLL